MSDWRSVFRKAPAEYGIPPDVTDRLTDAQMQGLIASEEQGRSASDLRDQYAPFGRRLQDRPPVQSPPIKEYGGMYPDAPLSNQLDVDPHSFRQAPGPPSIHDLMRRLLGQLQYGEGTHPSIPYSPDIEQGPYSPIPEEQGPDRFGPSPFEEAALSVRRKPA